MEERTPLTWAAFLTASGIWGSTFLVISIGNDALAPVWAAALRLGLAAVLLGGLAVSVEGGLPRGAAFRAAGLYGFFGFGVNFPLLYWAETIVPSGIAAVIFATIPLSTALMARAFGMERLTRMKIAGTLVALGGVALLFSAELAAAIPALPLLALLGGATSAALAGVLLKRGPRVRPFGANAVGAAVGFAVSLPVSFVVGEERVLPATFDAAFPVLYLTIVGSVGAYVLMAWLLNRWHASSVAFVTVIIPVIALALGAVVRDERPGPMSFVGAALVLAGIALDVRASRREVAAAAVAPNG